jgi:hypothetical protein
VFGLRTMHADFRPFPKRAGDQMDLLNHRARFCAG